MGYAAVVRSEPLHSNLKAKRAHHLRRFFIARAGKPLTSRCTGGQTIFAPMYSILHCLCLSCLFCRSLCVCLCLSVSGYLALFLSICLVWSGLVCLVLSCAVYLIGLSVHDCLSSGSEPMLLRRGLLCACRPCGLSTRRHACCLPGGPSRFPGSPPRARGSGLPFQTEF